MCVVIDAAANAPVHVVRVRAERRTQVVGVTADVRAALVGRTGTIVTVFVPHTTAGVVVQAPGEGATKVAADLETAFDQLVDGELALGKLQAIYLCEFDGPRDRELRIVVA